MAKTAAATLVLLAASLLITGSIAARERFTSEDEAVNVGRQLKDARADSVANALAVLGNANAASKAVAIDFLGGKAVANSQANAAAIGGNANAASEADAISGRRLQDASGSVKGSAQASGDYAQSFSAGQTFADSNPYASVSAGGGASAAVALKDGKPSISESIGSGYSASFLGQSQSRAQSSSGSNGNPGTSSSLGVQFGSDNGNAASSAGANSGTQAG